MSTSSLVIWLSFACLTKLTAAQRPNFIVMQPDDLPFFEEWTPPAHFPSRPEIVDLPTAGLPNIERLRTQGLTMKRAHTASPMCGTSRYSTITGRYPSRSSYGRNQNFGAEVASIAIPNTKLQDLDNVEDGYDCSEHNVAALLSQNGYHTGVVGKWHLSRVTNSDGYVYSDYQQSVRDCGFDFAEAMYAENMGGFWHDGTFSHNMEYVTSKALEFIDEARSVNEPFFLYLNPTVPHASGNVYEALTIFDCSDTPAGYQVVPPIKTMTEGTTCEDYRQTVIDRADGTENAELGPIWVDDSVGAILQHLEDTGEINNTFFLFQIDHGQEGKGSLYEPGTRIAQFVHYPDAFGSDDTSFDGLVSTIDIGPTILEYAGINDQSDGYYEMDGKSWKTAVEDADAAVTWKADRCLAFELSQARAITCGCDKFLSMLDTSTGTGSKGMKNGLAVDNELLFNLCDSQGEYLSSGSTSPEVNDIKDSEPAKLDDMKKLYDCHIAMTKPSLFPAYFECAVDFSPAPMSAPTPAPTPASTVCADAEDGSFTSNNGKARDCEWVKSKKNRCKLQNFGAYCPEKCGLCTPLQTTLKKGVSRRKRARRRRGW